MSHVPSLVATSAGPRIVVLGAGYAGLLAALRLAGRTRGRGRVTLVDASPWFVERIRAHERAAGAPLRRRDLARMVRGTGIELLVARAVGIDATSRAVELDHGERRDRLRYDALVYALGSAPRANDLPGAREHALFLSTEGDGARIDARLSGAKRAVVVGGGLTGIELAAELAERRPALEVSLLTRGDVAPMLSPRGRDYVVRTLGELGVRVRAHLDVRAVEADGVVADGFFPSDATIVATGFTPSRLAMESGLDVAPSGAVRVDATLRSVVDPHVWAAGDGASIVGATRPVRMACATAMPLGAHAADSVARVLEGREPRPFRFGYFVQCVSLGRLRGIVQRVTPDDVPTDTIVVGAIGARLKELVCRYTMSSMAIERLLPGTYTWPSHSSVADGTRLALA